MPCRQGIPDSRSMDRDALFWGSRIEPGRKRYGRLVRGRAPIDVLWPQDILLYSSVPAPVFSALSLLSRGPSSSPSCVPLSATILPAFLSDFKCHYVLLKLHYWPPPSNSDSPSSLLSAHHQHLPSSRHGHTRSLLHHSRRYPNQAPSAAVCL